MPPHPRQSSNTEGDLESQPNLQSLLEALLPTARLSRPPPHATQSNLTAIISSLQLHPTLEATLHLLNADLPSAHFLVRHMPAPPAIEGMLLHSILHRAEGDFENARAWAGDVGDACEGWVPKRKGKERLEESVVDEMRGEKGVKEGFVEFVYGGEDAGRQRMMSLIDDVKGLREGGMSKQEGDIDGRIQQELEGIIEWCKGKFGDGSWLDASDAFLRHGEEDRKIGEEMVSGDKGWRKF